MIYWDFSAGKSCRILLHLFKIVPVAVALVWFFMKSHGTKGSMVLIYMLLVTWLGYIDGIHVTIYSSIHGSYGPWNKRVLKLKPGRWRDSALIHRKRGNCSGEKKRPCMQCIQIGAWYIHQSQFLSCTTSIQAKLVIFHQWSTSSPSFWHYCLNNIMVSFNTWW